MNAQNKPQIHEVTPVANKEVSYKGNLSEGVKINDLSWAWSSQNACFPETQKHKFTGNHVFFTGIIPAYSEITVTVIPKDKSKNFSIYAYQVGVNKMPIVPELKSCIRCEVDHKWDRNHANKTQNYTRTVDNLVAINNPYRMIIGVTGADGLEEGEFTLVISTKSR